MQFNKYQIIVLLAGITVLFLTWTYGVSRFQVYVDVDGFGGVSEARKATVVQRIEQKQLTIIALFEFLSIFLATILLQNKRVKKS